MSQLECLSPFSFSSSSLLPSLKFSFSPSFTQLDLALQRGRSGASQENTVREGQSKSKEQRMASTRLGEADLALASQTPDFSRIKTSSNLFQVPFLSSFTAMCLMGIC